VFDITPIRIMIVLAIALLIFGPKRLPDMGRNLGRGIRDFKSGITGEDDVRATTATAAAAPDEPAPTAQELIADAATPESIKEELDSASERSKTAVG
jgi:sec-independent protein translocase protein TatA